jgi:hypothetical protein
MNTIEDQLDNSKIWSMVRRIMTFYQPYHETRRIFMTMLNNVPSSVRLITNQPIIVWLER